MYTCEGWLNMPTRHRNDLVYGGGAQALVDGWSQVGSYHLLADHALFPAPLCFAIYGRCCAELACIYHLTQVSTQQAIIAAEFQALYSALRAKQTPVLPPLEVTYTDFSLWQRKRLANGQLASSIAYWKEKLHGVPVLELPTDRPY